MQPVWPDKVHQVLSELKNSTATELENIDTYPIKLIIEVITPALTHIINLSFKQKIFPNYWKLSKVIPLHKKGDTLLPGSGNSSHIIKSLRKGKF